jgi:hypothetical protein
MDQLQKVITFYPTPLGSQSPAQVLPIWSNSHNLLQREQAELASKQTVCDLSSLWMQENYRESHSRRVDIAPYSLLSLISHQLHTAASTRCRVDVGKL